MEIKKCLSELYPTVHPFDGVSSIQDRLIEKEYVVVVDDKKEFMGILTPMDLIKRPHKIVIDCVTAKEHIAVGDSIDSIFEKYERNQCEALPVFQDNHFIGIMEKPMVAGTIKAKVNELYNKSMISEELKNSFLRNLSHEIRTPLNGILGFLEIIADLDVEDFQSKGQAPCGVIRQSAERFLLIMDDLINLSLINAGEHLPIEKDYMVVEGIFADLKVFFEMLASKYDMNLSIEYDNPNKSLILYSDGKKIKHILYHLLDNAVKFSSDHVVRFGYEEQINSIKFFVTNTGQAISEENKHKIFESFEKHDFAERNTAGLGIGLPLVKKLSEVLGGTVDFTSDETETTFFFTMPL